MCCFNFTVSAESLFVFEYFVEKVPSGAEKEVFSFVL